MPRVPLLNEATMGEASAELFESLPAKLNIFRVMAHADTTFAPQLALGAAILSRQNLGHRERELLILLVAHLEGGEYEWFQHVPIALGVGVPQTQIDAIQNDGVPAGVFSDREQALLEFGRQVIQSVRVSDEAFTEMKRHFTDGEIVEATLAIGFYMTMARLTEVTQTELDVADGIKAFESLQEAEE